MIFTKGSWINRYDIIEAKCKTIICPSYNYIANNYKHKKKIILWCAINLSYCKNQLWNILDQTVVIVCAEGMKINLLKMAGFYETVEIFYQTWYEEITKH